VSGSDPGWTRVKELFALALEQPAQTRNAWLRIHSAGNEALYAEVASLLDAQAQPADEFLDRGGARLIAPLLASDDAGDIDLSGKSIGAYRILRLLGEGGMGRVFLAERADGQFRQQVALKLIRAGSVTRESHERFLREREILARLTHANIGQLHDGGVHADGSPYFTLEYVAGDPITHWCDTHRLNIRGRVALMLKVCDAVQYAHRNLVVHRDIKPSNILVGADGEPKLLDFGIAKPLDAEVDNGLTATESRPMTREYAAPEQVLGEPITTATDVYSLGVLLYQLLSGQMPYARASRGETSWPKAIVEEPPESLSRAISRVEDTQSLSVARSSAHAVLRRELRGDLDRIVRRTLEKSPEARYPSVSALASDLRAWLEGRALPGSSTRYRIWKFVGRNRLAVGLATLLFGTVIASLAVAALQQRRIAVKAQDALRQAQTTTAVKDFLVGLFRGADPQQNDGKDISARELVDRGSQRIGAMQDQPLLRGELESVLGEIYNDIGRERDADKLEAAAIDDLAAHAGDPRLVAASEFQRSRAAREMQDAELAAKLSASASARLRALDPLPVADLARTTRAQAQAAIDLHKFDAATPFIDESIRLARTPGIAPEILADSLGVAATVAQGNRDLDRSQQMLVEEIVLRRSYAGKNDPAVAIGLSDLAGIEMFRGRPRESKAAYAEALDAAKSILGPNDPRLSNIEAEYAITLAEFGDFAQAEALLDAAESAVKTNSGSDSMAMIGVTSNRCLVLFHSEQYPRADACYSGELKQMEEQFGPNSPLSEADHMTLAYIRALEGQVDDAAQALAAIAQHQTARRGHATSQLLLLQGNVQRLQGNYAEAEASLRRGLEPLVASAHDNTLVGADFKATLGSVLADTKRYDEAEKMLRAALASYASMYGDVSVPTSARTQLAFAQVLTHSGHEKEALAQARSAAEALQKFYGADNAHTREARSLAAKLQGAR
jgi:eukaryotic-like serine/threonine-protein kinase